MADSDTPWEPPLAGSEAEHLLGALERLRATFLWKTDGLDAAGLALRIGASTLTLGGLLKHMAINEDFITTTKLTGDPVGEPWESLFDGAEDWEFTSAAADTPNSSTRSGATPSGVPRPAGRGAGAWRAGPVGGGQRQRRRACEPAPAAVRSDRGVRPGLTGHADLLREAVDGRVGEDPPPGWRPAAPVPDLLG